MSCNQVWRIYVKNLEVMMRVGCCPEEREPQRIIVNVVVEGIYSAIPTTLEECINYEIVREKVAKQWPEMPHTILLETRIYELLEYIFRTDSRVSYAMVKLEKPDIFPEMEAVGMSAEWTRADYEQICRASMA